MPMGTATDSAVSTAALTSPLWVQALHGPAQEFLVWGGCVLLVLRLFIAVRVLLRGRFTRNEDITP